MKKRNLIFCIIITVLAVLALATVFMPYVKVETKDTVDALNDTFGDIAEFEIETDEADSATLIAAKSGIKLFRDVADIEADETYSYISNLKTLIISLLLVSWIMAVAVIPVIWFLKKKARYIVSVILAALSEAASIVLYLTLPRIANHAIVEAIEKSLFDDTGIYESLLGELVKDTIVEYLGEFCEKLLQQSVQLGYWILMIAMGIAVLVSVLGLVLECVKGKSEGVSGIVAKLYGITGEYAGTEMPVDDGIVLGRDPGVCQLIINKGKISRKHCRIAFNKDTGMFEVTDYSSNGTYILGGRRIEKGTSMELPAGTIIQLGKDGDKFKLGN